MNEALKLTPVLSMPSPGFKDGDDGDGSGLLGFTVDVADNGYILSVMLDSDEGSSLLEVYNTTDELLSRIQELIRG